MTSFYSLCSVSQTIINVAHYVNLFESGYGINSAEDRYQLNGKAQGLPVVSGCHERIMYFMNYLFMLFQNTSDMRQLNAQGSTAHHSRRWTTCNCNGDLVKRGPGTENSQMTWTRAPSSPCDGTANYWATELGHLISYTSTKVEWIRIATSGRQLLGGTGVRWQSAMF